MINFGFTASTAGIGQAGGNPAGQGLVQRTNEVSGANAGFFGMLFALFARPVGTDQPVMPEGGAARPETDQGILTPDGSGALGSVIVSGDRIASGATVATPAVEVPGDAAPALAGEPVITEPLISETRSPAGGVSDEAGPRIPVLAGGDSDEIDALLTQVRGHHLKTLQDSIKWATDLQPAAKNAGGDVPLRNVNGMGSMPEQPKPAAVDGRGNAALPALNTEPGPETAPLNRISGFFANELFRVSADTESLPQSRTLEAFARMAEGCEVLRQTVLGDDTGQGTTVIPGQGVASTEEANGVSLTAARGEAVLADIVKMAPARRVEPVITREDVEDAFIFGAPQETVLSGGKGAPVEGVWARAVVSRVHDETVNARAAGKTSVSFDITTENGEIIRVRVAMRSNLVSGRIGVMNSGTRDILALHIPELNQRLEMENLIPERFDVYVMNGEGEGGRRWQERKARRADDRSNEQKDEDNFIYVSSGPKTFEKWA